MSFWGSSGYKVSKGTMRGVEDDFKNQAGQSWLPGSSGYSINNQWGVNPDTGRSFTTVPKFSDHVKEGNIDDAFAGISNAQGDALKRGQAGAMRGAASSFGRTGLGGGGLAKMMATQGGQTSRGLADIQRNTLMDKLGYGTDMYKFERGQGLQDELGLRGARQGDNTGKRQDVMSQYDMDRLKSQDAFNRQAQLYGGLGGFADKGSAGWGGSLLSGLGAGAGMIFGGPPGAAAGAGIGKTVGGMGGGGGGGYGSWLDENKQFSFNPGFRL